MPPNSSRPDPAAKTTQRSGIGPNSGSSGNGPKRALERPHPEPRRAAARKPNRPQRSLRAEDRSRGPNRPAEREWSGASLGGEQQIPKSAQRESSSSLEPTQRAQDRSRGLQRPAERERSAASLGGEQQIPKARSAKALPPQSLLSERRTVPAKHQLAQAHRRPLTPRAPFRIGASL